LLPVVRAFEAYTYFGRLQITIKQPTWVKRQTIEYRRAQPARSPASLPLISSIRIATTKTAYAGLELIEVDGFGRAVNNLGNVH
jgi:hypothetical protein